MGRFGYRKSKRCHSNLHRWVRRIGQKDGKIPGPVPTVLVGLKAPLSTDFCSYCRVTRAALEVYA